MMKKKSYPLRDTYEIEDLPPLQPKSSCCRKFFRCLLNNWFMISTIIGVIIGFGVGFVLKHKNISYVGKLWLGMYSVYTPPNSSLAMPGNLYIRVLQLTIIPMIIANLITVLANLNPKGNGKMSGITIACILIFNLISSLIGLTFALIIKPGSFFKNSSTLQQSNNDPVILSYIFRDLLLNIFPDNLIKMTLSQTMTNLSNPIVKNDEKIYIERDVSGTNMIGILFCSVAFGIAANATKEKATAFKDFFASLGDVIMYLMTKFLLVTPVCVMFMVMSSVTNVEEDLGGKFGTLALFVGVNFVGQVAHLIIMLLSTACFCKNPFRMLRYSLPPYFIGFATTSAIVSLPKCYDSCDKYGMPKSVSRFVLPIAGTMKSDASAIFIVSAVFYTVQDSGIALDVGKITIVIILATVYVSALPNIPSSSMVVAATILCSIGIGPENAMILFAVEFINDRLRSGNIVFSHLYCAAFVYHACEKDIKKQMEDEDGENEVESTTEEKYIEEESGGRD